MTFADLVLRRTRRLLGTRRLESSTPTTTLALVALESREVPAGTYTGTVFRDNNFDGAFTVANDQGFYKGVDVKAYDPTGALAAATQTAANGTYSLDTTGTTGPYRLELTVPANYSTGPVGADNKSSIRFVADGGGAGLHFGLVNPLDYSQAAPDLFTSSFSFGASDAAFNATDPAIRSFKSSAAGKHDTGGNTDMTTIAKVPQVGSVYGLAYQRTTDTVFAAAFLRRFVGMGPGGTGAIYTVDPGTGTVGTLIDLNNVPVGMIPSGSVATDFEAGVDTRNVGGYDYFTDSKGVGLTHRVALGDLDISEDGRTLFVVNLFKRELVEVPIDKTGALDTSRTLRRTPVPLTVGNDALNFNNPQDVRPFALSTHDGAVFVGSTYTAETSTTQSTLRGYIHAFNPTAGKFESFDQLTNQFTGAAAAPVLSADLSYERRNGIVSGTTFYDPNDPSQTINSGDASERNRNDTFRAWDNVVPNGFNRRHQPLLSDIEFDRGVMVLGIRDRYGDLIGWNLPGGPIGSAEGDMLRAHPNGAGAFTLESGGVSNGVTNAIGGKGSGAQTTLARGPGGADFYWSQYLWGNDVDNENYGFGHSFTAMGGLFQVPGGTQIATTIMDPFRYSTGGTSWFNNGTGTNEQDFEIYADGELGKVNGLGDLQAFVAEAPVEIGNRVWVDADADGVQDAGESVVAGLSVELWDLGGDGVPGGGDDTLVTTATTDAAGNYYFSGFNNAGAGSGYKGGLALLPNRKYEVRIPNAEGGSQQAALAAFFGKLTVADNDGTAGGDTRDSDAVLVGTTGVIAVTTGAPGNLNHTYDAGFIPALRLGNFVWDDKNNNGVFDAGELPLENVTVRLLDEFGNLLTSTATDSNGKYLFNNLSKGKFIVEVLPPAGYVTSTGKNASPTGSHEPGVSGTQDNEDHGSTVGATIRTVVITLGANGDTALNPDDSGTANLRQDFGLFRPLELGNFVWEDKNNNGIFDAGELPLANVTVELLTSGGTVLATQLTDGNGKYLFGLLGATDYRVRITPPAGYVTSTGKNSFATGSHEPGVSGTQNDEDHGSANGGFVETGLITIFAPGNAGNPDTGTGGANTANLRQDFGLFRPLELGNFVWDDKNNNGVFDAGEVPFANVTVELLNSGNTVITSQLTNGSGKYLFTNLVPGDYRVRITPPPGYVTSTGKNASPTGSHEPGVSGTQDNEDHGSKNGAAIETGLITLAAPGDGANPDTGTGGTNTANLRQDFGLFRTFSLGNRVWLDADNNGSINAEGGIDGVTVSLLADLDGDGNFTDLVATQLTAGGGYYRFDGLAAGKYIVEVNGGGPLAGLRSSTGAIGTAGVGGAFQPAPDADTNVTDSDDNGSIAGANYRSTVVILGPTANEPLAEADLSGGQGAADDQANMTVDFGFFRPMALGNRVWFDLDNNGSFNAGDASGPPGVAVNLLDAAGNPVLDKLGNPIATTTNAQGYYLFSGLNPGTYRVHVAASNFTGAGVLVGYASSTGKGNGTTTGPNEPIAVIAGDNADSGTTNGTLPTGGVRSVGLTLVNGTAPTSEEGSGTTPGIADPTADGDSTLVVDFGFIPVLSLGNRVWDDANNNGQFDAGEAALTGLTVNLLDSAGNAVTDGVGNKITTTTNAQGYYLFTNLLPGNYIVEIVAPAGYVSSTGSQGQTSGAYEPGVGSGNNDQDHGTANGPFFTTTSVRSGVVSLQVGTAPTGEPSTPLITDPATDANSNTTIDFGLFRPLSLGNRVWIDANNNGQFDAGEAAPGTVTVNLLDMAGTLLTSTTTTAQGYYLFTGLGAGDYRVEIAASNFTVAGALVGFTSSTGGVGGAGAFEPVAGGKGNNNQDHGTIFGTLGAGGSVRGGLVSLLAGSQTTNDEGADGNTPGITDPAPDANSEVTLDFGFFRPLSLGNRVWNDANNNGTFDFEGGLGNVTVHLYTGAGTKLATTTTTAAGYYLFTGLGEGSYFVEVDGATLPAGFWRTSTGTNGSATGAYEPAPSPGNKTDADDNGSLLSGTTYRSGTVTLTAGGTPTGEPATPGLTDPARDQDSDVTVDFGFYQPVSLGNLVWNDLNNNGTVDAGEPGLNGVVVRLFADFNQDGAPDGAAVATTTTNASGHYLFANLIPGTYLVEITAPAGFISSTGKNGNASGAYEAAPGANNDTDNDDNGTTTGAVIRSGQVTLSLGGEPTAEPGSMSLANPTPDASTNDTVDFGVFVPVALGNLVFFDRDNDGVFNGTDSGISGVTVSLLDSGKAVLATTTTDGNGKYLFTNLGKGDYYVEIAAPAIYKSSSGTTGSLNGPYEPTPGSNDTDNSDDGTATVLGGTTIQSPVVSIAAGTEPTDEDDDPNTNLTVDFGLIRTLSLGNLVWNDVNNSGKVDTGEAGLANVTVRLFVDANGDGTPDGAAIGTTTTDANGNYLFGGLTAGKYLVEVVDPTGYVPSSGKNGTILSGPYQPAPSPNTDLNDDDNGTIGAGGTVLSGMVTLTVDGEPTDDGDADTYTNLSVDFGYFVPLNLGNLVWNDVNNNGVVDAGEPGLSELPVRLYDSGGNLVASTVTAPDGKYAFTNLTPGNYSVEVDLPQGYTSSTGGVFGTGPFEAAPNPNGDTDNDDNGTATTGVTVRSGIVDLTLGGEPGGDGDGTNGNLTVDFGAFLPFSVGNLVFNDANNNGTADAGEVGIAGVPVRLYRDTNQDGVPDTTTPLGTTTTNSTGHYLFTGLGADAYVIELTAPGTLISSSGKNAFATGPFESAPSPETSTDSDDNGTSIGGQVIRSLPVILGPGEPTGEPATPGLPDATPDTQSNLTVDFGLFEPLAVGDLVWNDTNNNGAVDAGEPGLAGVTVRIYDTGGVLLAETTTDANGGYGFTNLVAGDYVIEVVPPTGFVSSTGGVNGTGPFEAAPSPNTDANNDDNGSTIGTVIRGTPVTLSVGGEPSGNTNPTVDFGLFRPLSIGNLVWNDINNNGRRDTGEPGLAGVTVRLYRETGGAIASVVTNSSGSYLFTGLGEGRFIVEVDGATLPAGMKTSSGMNASFSGPFESAPTPENGTDHDDNGSGTVAIRSLPVTLSLGGEPNLEGATPGLADPARDQDSNVTVDFGFFQPLSFGNTIWRDDNNNGKLDGSEPRFGGITVQLTDPAGNVIATTTTAPDGTYQFTGLIPADYIVRITPPPGVTPSTPVFPPLSGGDQQNIGTAAGPFIASPVITLAIGAAPLVGGNADPNNYVIGDFGLLALAEVCGYVYRDPNLSGTYDRTTGDSPIGGVTITLTGVDAGGNAIPARTTTTDVNGFYCFLALPPGTYTIRETQPTELLYDFLDTVGNFGGTAGNDVLTVTLAPNQSGQNYNFSEVPPADPFGYVWVDLNRNCIRDPGEPAIPGVPITISGIAFAGTPLARPLTAADVPGGLTQVTDINGRYDFLVMPPGLYTITQDVQPTGYIDGCEQNGDPGQNQPTVGNDRFDAIRLDPNPIRGPFNFGEFVDAVFDPTKRQFLGSTPGGVQRVVGNPAPGGVMATRANLPLSPTFRVTTGNPAVPTLVATAAGAGYTPEVRVFNYATGGEQLRFLAYEATFTGGVRVATGDVNGDGVEDVLTGIGVGGGPRVRVFNGVSGTPIYDFFAYEPTFTGGLFVTSADVTGDGIADIITGVDTGGGPRVQVFNGRTGDAVVNFFAFDSSQRGGVRVAAADVNGDGVADLVATTGAGVPTMVRVFNVATLAVIIEFAPYTPTFSGGVSIAAADVTGDGFADIIAGADVGGGPHVQVFDGRTRASIASFFAYESTFTGGVRVGAADVNGDGRADVVTAPGPGGASRVRVLRAADQFEFDAFYPMDPEFTGGVYIG